MARKASGQIIPPKDGRGWAIRFRAYGERRYVALGSSEEGWSRQKAEDELANVQADVRRGTWRPHEPESVEAPAEVPTLHEFASEWFDGASPGWRERTRVDYRWRLSDHLLPYFAKHRLSAITVEEVDRYRRAKVRESKALEKARCDQLGLPASERKRLPARSRTAQSTRRSACSP